MSIANSLTHSSNRGSSLTRPTGAEPVFLRHLPVAPLNTASWWDESAPLGVTFIYRLFDAGGRLLYIGITHNVKYRWQDHRRRRPWWPEVASASIHLCDAWSSPAWERIAIRTETPQHNRQHVVRHG